MKLRKAFGAMAAMAAMAFMCVGVQAAQYSVTSTLSDDLSTVTMTVNVAPDSDASSVAVNGYAVQVDYDSTVLTPVVTNETDATGANLYATNLITDNGSAVGVTVADLVDNDGDVDTVAIGWANDTAVTFTEETAVAEIKFTVISQTDTAVTVDVVALANDASTMDTANISDTTEEAVGTVTFSADFLRGDANGDGVVDATDASLIAKSLVGLGVVEDANTEKADANIDDTVDATDASLIAKSLVGLGVISE